MITLVVVGIVTLLSQAEGFALQPSTTSRINMKSVKRVSSSSLKMVSPVAALQAMAPLSKLILGLPVMYCLFSANEYVTHRYYQHNEIGKMFFYKTLRKFGLFPKIDGGG